MKHTIILLLALLFISCDEGKHNKAPCNLECSFSIGDMVNFKGQKRTFIIDNVRTYGCKCEYDGYYFDKRGERKMANWVSEYELEYIQGE